MMDKAISLDYTLEQVKEWRREQEKAGAPSGLADFAIAHGLLTLPEHLARSEEALRHLEAERDVAIREYDERIALMREAIADIHVRLAATEAHNATER